VYGGSWVRLSSETRFFFLCTSVLVTNLSEANCCSRKRKGGGGGERGGEGGGDSSERSPAFVEPGDSI